MTLPNGIDGISEAIGTLFGSTGPLTAIEGAETWGTVPISQMNTLTQDVVQDLFGSNVILNSPNWTATTAALYGSGRRGTPGNAVPLWLSQLEQVAQSILGVPEQTWDSVNAIVEDLGGYFTQLQTDATNSQAANVAFLQAIKTAWTNDTGNPLKFIQDLSAAAQTWWTAQTNISADETVTLEQMLESAFGIDPSTGLVSAGNVSGVGGAQTLIDTFDQMWNQAIAALQADLTSVGLSGFAQSLNGLAVQTSSAQSMALSAAQVQAIVNNQPVAAGLEATVESNGDFHSATGLSNPISEPASIGSFVTVSQAKTLGFVQWIGSYQNGSEPTGFVINFYKMDSSGNLDLLFSSPDLHATLSNSVAWYVWDIPTVHQIDVVAGDVIAVEFQVTSSAGIVYPFGFTSPVAASHPSAAVKQLGFTQDWSGAASTITAAHIGWSQYAPYVGLGVGTPPPTPYAPQSIPYYSSSTHVPESWATYVDLVGVGDGGGGEGETGAGNGDGGLGGAWVGATLMIGVTNTAHPGMDIPVGGEITITVGTGGAGGPYFTPGGNGSGTIFSWVDMAGVTQTLTAGGGLGGQPTTNISSWGESPGNFTYNTTAPSGQSTVYIGGSINSVGGTGNAPGGGGAGGAAFQYGFAGAPGQAWTVDRQS